MPAIDQIIIKKYTTATPDDYVVEAHPANDYLGVGYTAKTGVTSIRFFSQVYTLEGDHRVTVEGFVKNRMATTVILTYNGETIELTFVKGIGP